MFDVRPAGWAGDFDFQEVQREVNLRIKSAVPGVSMVDKTGLGKKRFWFSSENQNLENPQDSTIDRTNLRMANDTLSLDINHPQDNSKGPILTKPKASRLDPITNYRLPIASSFVPKTEIDEDLFYKLPKPSSKKYILEELEKVLAEPIDPIKNLTNYGVRVHGYKNSKPRPRVTQPSKIIREEIFEKNKLNNQFGQNLKAFWFGVEPESNQETETRLANVREPEIRHSPASREIEIWLENLKNNKWPVSQSPQPPNKLKTKKQWLRIQQKFNAWFKRNKYYFIFFLAIGGLALNFVYQNGIGAKKKIIQNGDSAVTNLEEAKKDLEEFKFLEAADRFALAYDDFDRASGTLSQLGANFLSIFGALPGLDKISAANNLVEAGQSISKAGENLSLAFGTLYKTNLLSFLDASGADSGGSKSISKILTEFRDVLVFAEKNIDKADKLLAEINSSVLPSDKQPMFLDFKEKIPDFRKYIGDAVDYSEFLLDVVGDNGAKTYLVLLQNNSELRPTGGFPGTYAILTFENGSLKKIFVDDIYRLDATLKENIVPPKPLQHITPNWGLRDAAWWADFPTSARKVSGFYKLDTGDEIDGVFTVTPTVIRKIFEIIGPIEMPEYTKTLVADNFLHEIQNEVEYEADRSAPKQIIRDLQPLFFKRLSQQDKSKWVEIFKVLLEAAKQKHILAYFNNDNLEEIAVKNGLGGEVKQIAGDYLQVVFSNVKGSKTDFVTDSIFNLDIAIGDGGLIDHVLKITRTHNGGKHKYGFYNRDNSAYVKIYVPSGSKLTSIQGNSITDYRPLIGHDDFGFKKDPDLARVEASINNPFPDVDVFEESGKTVFGFWLITKPGQTKSAEISYQIPYASVCVKSANVCDGYKLYWQKQSGTIGDRINFSFALPEEKQAIDISKDLQLLGNNLVLNSDLTIDRDIDFKLR